ncbi:ABC transporter permease [Fulvivirga ligni]|uniref:ABC transporter permease n=1 Tax=Fulvivirga ligni TaxID=2904246 RepID=UPI001F1F5943|nr:ABC transporter permease [Fulvivirga ligni]UII23203.1 ABC transporter permease [Fulvivirga ligni]
MLKSYLKVAVRNLLKRKVYSFINIFGLATGMAVCLVILKYVDFELSYDSFHEKSERIYRVTTTSYQNNEFRAHHVLSGYALGPALKTDIPEVESYIRTHPMYGGAVISYGRESADASSFFEENIQFVDSNFFNVFTYEPIKGNLSKSLEDPNSMVLTEKMATKYFHDDEDPIGKTMTISGGWADHDYTVTAIIENPPGNSHFPFDFIVPIHNLLQGQQYQNDDGWGWNNFITYAELIPNVKPDDMKDKMEAFVKKYRGEEMERYNSRAEMIYQPIEKIHLEPGLANESSETVSINTIYFFIIISIFIMAIAWVNYINLSTARAMERAREIGIKKAIGAYKQQLIGQFLLESIVVNLLGVIIAMVMAVLLLPVLSSIVGKNLYFDFNDPRLWMILGGLFLFGSVISGIYPAFVLSSFNTIAVLKGSGEKAKGGFSLRKTLVVFQFVASMILIAGTFAVYQQITFMRDQDKGLTMDKMLVVKGPKVFEGENFRTRLTTLKDQLTKVPGVTQVATSGAVPGGGYNWGTSIRKDGTDRSEGKNVSIVWVDPDFVKTYDITVLAGRSFNPEITSDMESVLVNEAALKAFDLGSPEEAVTQNVIMGGDTCAILGVLKNYNWNSLKTEHQPWLLRADTISSSAYSLHLTGNNIDDVIDQAEDIYKEAFPGNPFDYFFLDDFFDKQYKAERQFGKIFSLFAVLAITIACLGLWGLASYDTSQKLREISIRKVMGASVNSIVSLLSWQFLKLVIIASAVALPLTWYGINSWLDNFAFRIGLSWDLFVIPVAILTLLALGTVSLHILKGANSNPAKVLRSE